MYQRFIPEGWIEEESKYTMQDIIKAKEESKVLQGKIESIDNMHNAYITLGENIKGIIQKDDLGIVSKDNPYVQFKVSSIKNNNICYLSRKVVKAESLAWAVNDLSKGDIVDGIVRNIKPYGAFIEIGGGTSGLLYINDISVSRMKSPEEKLKIGQKIKVKIKNIDKERNKFFLSYKELLGTWEENVKGLKEGDIVKGTVKEKTKNSDGIFIELKPNLVGLCEYEENLKYGQEVNVRLKKIIPDKKKIKLSIVSC